MKHPIVKASVVVTLKKEVLDPQGKTILQAAGNLGLENVADVRFGKFISLTLRDVDQEEAYGQVEAMCQKLLANPVIEEFKIEISIPE